MERKKYRVEYTRLFKTDLMRAVDYITDVLENPDAALQLADDTEAAITKRSECAESFEPYREARYRKHPYYRIYVHSYTVFYVVIGDVMEVRRFLYSASDLPKQL